MTSTVHIIITYMKSIKIFSKKDTNLVKVIIFTMPRSTKVSKDY